MKLRHSYVIDFTLDDGVGIPEAKQRIADRLLSEAQHILESDDETVTNILETTNTGELV